MVASGSARGLLGQEGTFQRRVLSGSLATGDVILDSDLVFKCPRVVIKK